MTMVTPLQLVPKNIVSEDILAKSSARDLESLPSLSFGEILKLKEQELQKEQEVSAASVAAALAVLQTAASLTRLPVAVTEATPAVQNSGLPAASTLTAPTTTQPTTPQAGLIFNASETVSHLSAPVLTAIPTETQASPLPVDPALQAELEPAAQPAKPGQVPALPIPPADPALTGIARPKPREPRPAVAATQPVATAAQTAQPAGVMPVAGREPRPAVAAQPVATAAQTAQPAGVMPAAGGREPRPAVAAAQPVASAAQPAQPAARPVDSTVSIASSAAVSLPSQTKPEVVPAGPIASPESVPSPVSEQPPARTFQAVGGMEPEQMTAPQNSSASGAARSELPLSRGGPAVTARFDPPVGSASAPRPAEPAALSGSAFSIPAEIAQGAAKVEIPASEEAETGVRAQTPLTPIAEPPGRSAFPPEPDLAPEPVRAEAPLKQAPAAVQGQTGAQIPSRPAGELPRVLNQAAEAEEQPTARPDQGMAPDPDAGQVVAASREKRAGSPVKAPVMPAGQTSESVNPRKVDAVASPVAATSPTPPAAVAQPEALTSAPVDRPSEKQPEPGRTLEVQPAPASPVTDASKLQAAGKAPGVPLNAQSADVVRQIMQQLHGRLQSGSNSMRLQLNPKELGEISVEMVSSAQGVSVTFFAEQPGTGRMLESQMQQLRQSLTDSGVQLTNLNLSQQRHSGQEGGFSNRDPQLFQAPQREATPADPKLEARPRPAPSGARSDGIDYLI